MESFSRGWNFLKQAWIMAFKDKDLIKPSIYSLVVGFVVSIIGIIPIGLAGFLLGDSRFGQGVMVIFGGILMFVNFTVTYVFSGMTAYLIYGYLSEGDGRMDKAWAIVKRDLFDLMTLAAVSTVVNMLKNASKNKKNQRGLGGIVAGVARSAIGLLDVLWTEASFLILPAMVIDDLNLKDAAQRVWNITKQNLLLVGISTVGVRGVTGLIGFLLGATGAVIGFAVGYGIAVVAGSNTFVLVTGIVIGVMIFMAFTLVASVISSYTGVAYHTCLYIWARDEEKAVAAGQQAHVHAPQPLAAVLG